MFIPIAAWSEASAALSVFVPPKSSVSLSEPIISHVFSKPSMTVTSPVCGFVVSVPASEEVITRIAMGIHSAMPSIM